MSIVIRLNDLLTKTGEFDEVYLNGELYSYYLLEASNNPLVHIDLVETIYPVISESDEEYYEANTTKAKAYYTTIV